ncbi:MAG: methylmalonyl Co-A mutase-associated GTPase MeaB, partial [Arenibacterium sp.]
MDIADLSARIESGERRALARAITLVESGRDDHRAKALNLLENLSRTGREALRIGLSGTPGVGKSTFIEAFGMMLIRQGLKVAGVGGVFPPGRPCGVGLGGDTPRGPRLRGAHR